MKVCSLYGVGYYYIPGTDTCIKIGGYVRFESYYNENGTGTGGAYPTFGTNGVFTRNTSTFGMMARFRLTSDVRTQTEYGTLRSYFSMGFNIFNTPLETSTSGSSISMERAFVQFAGFTVGRADSFFAFYNGAAYGFVPLGQDGSSGPAGKNVFAYTAQFGNGLSATLSLEDSSYAKAVTDLNAQSLVGASFGASAGSDNQGFTVPDIVGSLRVDQAWGSAQVMGALHQVGARYYNSFPTPNCTAQGAGGNVTTCDYPGDKWGWAVGAGLTLNMPWDKKDTLSGVIAYSEGATGYVGAAFTQTWLHKQGVSVGAVSDAVFAQPNSLVAGYDGSIQLTKAWGGTVAFEHYWTPALRTSWVFGYTDFSYGSTAKALIAANGCAAAGAGITNAVAGRQTFNCNPDFNVWRLASRTMWNPVANLDVGVEVAYSQVNTGFAGVARVVGTNGLATGVYNIEDQGVWSATFRVQRSFWP